MKNILTIISIIFAANQVFSETNIEVVESFVLIFEQLHQDISDIQSVAHIAAREVNVQFTLTVYRADNLLTQNQKEAKAILHIKIQETLKALNLSPKNEKVKKCIANTDITTSKLILRSEGGLQVCKTADADQITKATVLLNEVYNKQAKEHRDLEATKKQCNSTVKNPAQLRNCLYYQLFVVHTDLIKKLKGESEQVLKNYKLVAENVEEKLQQCSDVVKKNIVEEVDQIVLQFHNCCSNILESKRNS